MLIFKIYERVFLILGNINTVNILEIMSRFSALIFKADRSKTLKELFCFLEQKDFVFLFKLMVGALFAIISLSSLMKYLIVHQFAMTYALFFGLILVSIIIPVKMLKERKAGLICFFLLGAIATIYLTWAVNPYDKVEKKSRMVQALYEQGQPQAIGKNNSSSKQILSFTGKYSTGEYLYATACGAVSISAMVLPGISGSLVLILMGEYFEVVSAISGLKTLNLDNIAFLCCFGVGIVFGGLLFAKLVSAVLKRYYNGTMAFLIGLMTGSLYALWPFKKSIIMIEQYVKEASGITVIENSRIYTNILELPVMGPELYLSFISFLIGCLIMYGFVRKEIQE